MHPKHFTVAALAATLVLTPATRVAADAGDVAAGLFFGAILNEAARNNQRTTTRKVYRKPAVSSAVRAQNRETQTSLNYFGFPAGVVDGVMGRNSRNAISQYQAHMGYPATGQLTQYERDFLITSYHRAIAGGQATSQMIAAHPQGPRGLLKTYQQQLAAGSAMTPVPQTAMPGTTVVVAPQVAPSEAPAAKAEPETPVVEAAKPAAPALPNFMGQGEEVSLASHCNKVSLLTNTNGGFTTLASMSDPAFALNEQFCLARTYAIAAGEEMIAKVQGFSPEQIAEQCRTFGPALKEPVAALSLKPKDAVLQDVGAFVLSSGMSPAQLASTAKICLSVGYRTDDMKVAIGSALVLTVLGEQVYAELLGHHISQGFGATKRSDLSLPWYQASFDAIANGAKPVFAPGQPERDELLQKAAFSLSGRSDGARMAPKANDPQPAALPTFSVEN
ncbi:peptidoglycan hydrolase-like protein with peptidoglycan-binding domain [Rhodovulum iodosum]|uniref:Peptidoglycan hydrolase-like protein with peptidoglycan-binding domain n=1 Tax=Rhodovulum iodosum TaxID=68291 RepID=A0ABV3XNM9_9RHOB|nr:peptidoglycan-binding domain-containing protein [Rhodovulum robiginosum]RSK34818.1 hypothetical protein EJA01_07655 [Rhodovulum robiginosum]